MLTRTPRTVSLAAAATLAALTLTGCSAASDTLSQGQQALGSAREAIGAAQGLIGAGAELAAACAAAQAAWVPGVTPDDAYRAINEATAAVDRVLATQPNLPGAAEIDQALTAARSALASDETSLGVARDTLQTACSLVSSGG